MEKELSRDFIEEEIKVSLQRMHPTKAPKLDGLPPLFYQQYWSIVRPSIMAALLKALNSGQFPNKLNHTFITLIQKKQPYGMADCRHISLCSVLYKLISKVIANRLRLILPHVIFESKSAFVPKIQITNNILIAYAIVHFLRRKKIGKQGYMLLKLDMSKAYDQVEQSYLRCILEVMRFPCRLIYLIMLCVDSATFSIFVNGSPKGHIIPSRGIRQRDPLSPFLFLLCTKEFVSLLHQLAPQR